MVTVVLLVKIDGIQCKLMKSYIQLYEAQLTLHSIKVNISWLNFDANQSYFHIFFDCLILHLEFFAFLFQVEG